MTVHDEASDGDLGSAGAPTVVGDLSLGANLVLGSLNFTSLDSDAFTFSVPDGLLLDSLTIEDIDGERRFLAFNDGPVSQFDGEANLISTLVGESTIGVNLLTIPSIDQDFSGSGANPPLGPGDYTLWIQETDGSPINYTLQLVTSVPEPSAALLACLAFSLAAGRPKRS